MKIAILTSGRYHVCDLARELQALGRTVSFYSCVPAFRTQKFGLPSECSRSLFPYLGPFFAFMRKTQHTALQPLGEILLVESLDRLASAMITLSAGDLFIGMSGMSMRTAARLRARGVHVWIERGSRHITSQRAILDSISSSSPGRRSRVSNHAFRRELEDYAIADTIVVPSRHVEQSFLEEGVPEAKLFRNPYGVDLSMFPPTEKPKNARPTILFVGTWSLQKGCDLLWHACKPSWRLVHVGAIGDAPVPTAPNFEHREPVPQWKLSEQFAQADVFAIASRQDGIALVQAQALASGLPVVCTDRTGGADLADFLDDKRWVHVVRHDQQTELRRGLEIAIELSQRQKGLRDILGEARNLLSWKAYGARYSKEIDRRLGP